MHGVIARMIISVISQCLIGAISHAVCDQSVSSACADDHQCSQPVSDQCDQSLCV